MWLTASGKPAGTPSMPATRASPWDSPAVRNRNIPLMATTLLYFFGAGGGGGGCAASTFRTDGVMNTTSSRPVVCEAVVLNSHPRTGMSPEQGSFRTSSASTFVVTPPMTRRSPSLMRTSVCALRLLMTGGAPAVVPRLTVVLLRELFSIVTFILILVMSPSRMTVGITSSLSTASLNWICVPAELTVAYGISSPSEIEAVPFSTVTTSGRASVRVLLSRRSASSARLTLYRLLVKPNAIPPAPAGTTPPPSTAPIGRLTRFPPIGKPVVPLTGRVLGKPVAAFGGPNTLATGTPPCTQRLLAVSLVNPRPTRIEFWLA